MLTHTQERPRECTHCSKKFRYYRDLKDHLRSHSGVLPFDCSTCGSKFRRARDLKRHIKEQHATKKYKCSECNKVFGRKYYLEKYHMKTHIKKVSKKNTASSTCNRCLKDFSLKEMANHSCKPVSPSKTFHCTKCGKTFQKKRSLSAHLESSL
ncbi:Zinc finger protein interacting with ribonucleoprotein K [Armadillidium vulgare]|nr:Zinc finger protein interacting with ribonucleoprotein K [Armadillidium vulgare]